MRKRVRITYYERHYAYSWNASWKLFCIQTYRRLGLPLGTIHKGRPQNFRDFGPPPPPCPHFGYIYKSKSTQPPLLCLLLGYPPPPLPVRTSFMYGPQVTLTLMWGSSRSEIAYPSAVDLLL